MWCNLFEIYQLFGRTFCLHPQGQCVNQASRKNWTFWLLGFFLYPGDEGRTFIRNVGKGLPEYGTSEPRRQYYSLWFNCPTHTKRRAGGRKKKLIYFHSILRASETIGPWTRINGRMKPVFSLQGPCTCGSLFSCNGCRLP